MAVLWLVVGVMLATLAFAFAAQNPQAANVFFFGTSLLGMPLWLVALTPAVAGLFLGYLLAMPGRVRAALAGRRLTGQVGERDRAIGQLQQRVAELERDLAMARRPVPIRVEEPPAEAREVPDGSSRAPAHAA